MEKCQLNIILMWIYNFPVVFTIYYFVLIPSTNSAGPCKDFSPCIAAASPESDSLECASSVIKYREKYYDTYELQTTSPSLTNWTQYYQEMGQKHCESGEPCVPVDPTSDKGHDALIKYVKYDGNRRDKLLVCNSIDKSKRCPNGALCRLEDYVDGLSTTTATCPFPAPDYGEVDISEFLNLTNPYTHDKTWQDFLGYAGQSYCSSGTCIRAIPKHEDDVTSICVDPNQPNYDPWDIKCENNQICFLSCPKPLFDNADLVRQLFKYDFFGIRWTNEYGRGDCSPKYNDKCYLSEEDQTKLDKRLEYLGLHYCKSGRCGYTYQQTLEYLIPICVDENWIPPSQGSGKRWVYNKSMILSFITAHFIIIDKLLQ